MMLSITGTPFSMIMLFLTVLGGFYLFAVRAWKKEAEDFVSSLSKKYKLDEEDIEDALRVIYAISPEDVGPVMKNIEIENACKKAAESGTTVTSQVCGGVILKRLVDGK